MLRRFFAFLRSKEIKAERVVIALILLAVVVVAVWFGWDFTARQRATSIYDTIHGLLEQAPQKVHSDFDVHQAVGRQPSYSRASGMIELQDDYVFDGPTTAYT